MARQAAFLRGMNLGKRRVTNDELKAVAATAGFTDVDAVLASGNLVFDTELEPADTQTSLSGALTEAFGYEVAVFVRTRAELEEIVGATPFTDEELSASEGRVQVTLLPADPDPSARRAARALESDHDRIRLGSRLWFWLPKTGISTSELDLGELERCLGVGTTRTRNTIAKVLAKFP